MEGKQAKKIINGVDTARLFETVESIRKTPNLAVFRFRLNNIWFGGDGSAVYSGVADSAAHQLDAPPPT